MVKAHFLLSPLELSRKDGVLRNFDTAYGAPMHQECISKLLLPRTLNTVFGAA